MRFENHFDVDTPVEEVWDAVLDVERVAPAVPGAQVLERTSDNAYKVAIKVKVGPMSMTYQGEVEITERDESEHRAVMKARAKESRGQGTANADVTMVLAGADGHTSATVTTDVELSGRVATMGQGVLQDVSGRLVETFAKNLAVMLEGGEPPQAGAPARPMVEEEAAEARQSAGGPATVDERSRAETMLLDAGAFQEPGPERPRPPAAEPADALDLGSLGGAVVADRMRDPRALGGLLAGVALLFFLLGRRSAR